MPEIDYSKTVVYKIKCKQPEIKAVYFGHTTSFRKCKYDIHNNCINSKAGEMYDTIRANGGFDNWTITVVERYRECMTKRDAILRVEKFYNEQNDNNTQPPPDNNSNEFFCTNCGNKFARKDSLTKHVKYRCKQAIQETNILLEKDQEINNLKQKLVEKDQEIVEKDQEIDNLKKYLAILLTLLHNP